MRRDNAHPQRPPNLPPPDFLLLTKLKSVPKGQPFESVKETKENLLAELSSIPKEAFHECFQNWKKRREQCIRSGGEYFEGDKDEELQIKWANDLFKLFRIFMDRTHIQPKPISYPSQ